MIHRFFILSFFIGFNLWSQTDPNVRIIEAKDIPIDTTLQVSEIHSFSTTPVLSTTDSLATKPQEEIVIIEPAGSLQPETGIQNTVVDGTSRLQDDPELAQLDKRWMDLVRQTDLYDASSYNIKEIPLEDIVVEDLPTEVLKSRLAVIDAKTPFHVTYNPDLERLIKTFLKTRKEALSNVMAKSKYFFPIFEEALDKYDIPLEVKYLAIVESVLRPKARSRMGASGLWQFMYQTGKQYGLTVSSYVDERQDPVLATEAACKYISDLHDIFGDWDLALAAYNSGPGNVSKAIRRSGGYRNYWNIRQYLPRETASYLPIFYATLYLFEYAEDHNLKASDAYDLHRFEVDTVQVQHTLTFDQIQAKTGIDASLLSFLNPAYKLSIIPKVPKKNYTLTLPRDYVGLFVQNEKAIYAYAAQEEAKREKPLPKYAELNQRIRYRVRSGDYLGKIAGKYGVSVRSIKRWNHLRSNKLRIGQRLTIYPRRLPAVAKSTPKKTKTHPKKPLPKGDYILYTVQEGDSLWSISQKYPNISVQQIREWNNIWGNKLKVGMKLRIYKG